MLRIHLGGRDIHKRLVDAHLLHEWGLVPQDAHNGFRHLAIAVEVPVRPDGIGTQPPCNRCGLGTVDTEGARFVGRRRDDPVLVGVATDDNRLSAPARMVELLDGREEGVEIDKQDRRALPRLQERFGKSVRHREPTCAGSIARACRGREGSSRARPEPRESTGRQAPRRRHPT